jgi:glycine cleavage system H protein
MVAIFVAFMFLSLVLADLGVEKWKAWKAVAATHPAKSVAAFSMESLWQVPEGVYLSSAHTWFRPDPAGGLEIGVDPLITRAIGAIGRIIPPEPGEQVAAGQPLFKIERDGRSITVPSSVTGKVVAVNRRLQDQPSLLNSDPYGAAWICHVTPTSIGSVTPSLRFGEKAILWLESEFTRLREFLSAQVAPELALGITSQDGGVPSSGCLAELDSAAWSAFESEFLNRK